MAIFSNLNGTSEKHLRIGVRGTTIYAISTDPTVTPPVALGSTVNKGDIVLTTDGNGAPYLYDGTAYRKFLVGKNIVVDNIQVDQVATFADGSASAPSITFTNDTDTGIFRAGAGELAFTNEGTKSFSILADGTGAFLKNVSIAGDLLVSGTTTTINTQDLLVKDKIITLNSGEAGAGVSGDGFSGIEVDRGTSDKAVFRFNEATDKWEIGFDTTPATAYASVLTSADDNWVLNTGDEMTGSLIMSGAATIIQATNGTTAAPSVAFEEATNGFSSTSTSVSTSVAGVEKLKVQTVAGEASFIMGSTDGVQVPVGTAAERPSTVNEGTIRYNSDTKSFEGYQDGQWDNLGGGIAIAYKEVNFGDTPDSGNDFIIDALVVDADVIVEKVVVRVVTEFAGGTVDTLEVVDTGSLSLMSTAQNDIKLAGVFTSELMIPTTELTAGNLIARFGPAFDGTAGKLQISVHYAKK